MRKLHNMQPPDLRTKMEYLEALKVVSVALPYESTTTDNTLAMPHRLLFATCAWAAFNAFFTHANV